MLTLLLATLDFAVTQFIVYSPWAKTGHVFLDAYSLKEHFDASKESEANWKTFYSFLILSFLTGTLGWVSVLVTAFGSERDVQKANLSGAFMYCLQTVSLIVSGAIYHDAIADVTEGEEDSWTAIYLAPAALWVVVAHSIVLLFMLGATAMKR